MGCVGQKGTFSTCTVWYVEALARPGRFEHTRYVFEKILTYANHVVTDRRRIRAVGAFWCAFMSI